ncbi:MAG: MBL fold metallo-hydrolase [Chloroflexota bacterium]|nr:MBL fold metallo-hydrolase [Chloroflexota bacterium]
MQRERIADDIYVFVSDRYVQVTATVVLTSDGVVLFDTLLYPDETRQIKRFVESRLGSSVRYVINSHFHADHTTGTCLFPEAQVIAHTNCRDLLDTRGRAGLERARTTSDEMRDALLVLPGLVFGDEGLTLHVGNKTFELAPSPGHSPDSITCFVREDRVLLAGDTVMSLPYFVDGSYDDLLRSLGNLLGGNFEHIVQGHGEVVLRGEVEEKLHSDLAYLTRVRDAVSSANDSGSRDLALAAIHIEQCGKSRILLNGVAETLHRQNVMALANRLHAEA